MDDGSPKPPRPLAEEKNGPTRHRDLLKRNSQKFGNSRKDNCSKAEGKGGVSAPLKVTERLQGDQARWTTTAVLKIGGPVQPFDEHQ